MMKGLIVPNENSLDQYKGTSTELKKVCTELKRLSPNMGKTEQWDLSEMKECQHFLQNAFSDLDPANKQHANDKNFKQEYADMIRQGYHI